MKVPVRGRNPDAEQSSIHIWQNQKNNENKVYSTHNSEIHTHSGVINFDYQLDGTHLKGMPVNWAVE